MPLPTAPPAAIVADRTLTLPLITGSDTLPAIGLAQTWTAVQTHSANISLSANADMVFTGTTGTNDIVLTDALADALSITDGSADILVIDTSTTGNVATWTAAFTISGAVSIDDTTASTSDTTGSVHTDGGLGVTGDIYLGTAFIILNTSGALTTTEDGIGTDANNVVIQSVRQMRFVIDADNNSTGMAFIWRHNDAMDAGTEIANLNESSDFTLAIAGGDFDINAGFIQLAEMTAPGAGAADHVRIYAVIDGGSLTDLAAVFQDGTIDVFAQEV